jgi:hypothetical protein
MSDQQRPRKKAHGRISLRIRNSGGKTVGAYRGNFVSPRTG